LELREGLTEKMQVKNFTEVELKKIGLARMLCSSRKVLLLDSPFEGLSSAVSESL
jgi:ABC-type branched-subunit amino acid transport system ATPase component